MRSLLPLPVAGWLPISIGTGAQEIVALRSPEGATVLVEWEMTPDDVRNLQSGGRVRLEVVSGGLAPLRLYVASVSET